MHKPRYELKHSTFRPSEEKIAGKGYEMTGHHLVHADEKGNVAVLAILLEKKKTTLRSTLWKDLPKEK